VNPGTLPAVTDRETPVSIEFVLLRVEACACGGLLRAKPDNERAVLLAVMGHRKTWRHQEWLARLEAEG
jgi:hypothetical protein